MRIVYFMRTDAARHVGGQGSGKVARYVDYLRAAGIDASTWASDRDPPWRCDIGHVLNLDWPVEVARQTAAARRRCGRVVLSPIHHCDTWVAALNHEGRRGLAGFAARRVAPERFEALRGLALAGRAPLQLPEAALQLVRGVRSRQRQVLASVDLCLPLADGELRSLAEDFGFEGPARIVPNAAEHENDADPPAGLPEDYLLCVGRVETRKNQVALLEAASRLGLPVVLAGPPNKRHRAMVRAVEDRVEASSAITWFRDLPRPRVLALYRGAAVHVLPSWCEVVAQVDLEAAAAGTRVVTTTNGHMDEYLGADASYWNPATGSRALAGMIAAALERPRPDPRPARFPLERTGERLVEAYQHVLAHDRPREP